MVNGCIIRIFFLVVPDFHLPIFIGRAFSTKLKQMIHTAPFSIDSALGDVRIAVRHGDAWKCLWVRDENTRGRSRQIHESRRCRS